MAVSAVIVQPGGVAGQTTDHLLVRTVDVTFDASYVTNGEPMDFLTLGFTSVIAVIQAGQTVGAAGGGYLASYDYTNSKILMFRQTAATSALIEVANAVDLSGTTIRFVVIGT